MGISFEGAGAPFRLFLGSNTKKEKWNHKRRASRTKMALETNGPKNVWSSSYMLTIKMSLTCFHVPVWYFSEERGAINAPAPPPSRGSYPASWEVSYFMYQALIVHRTTARKPEAYWEGIYTLTRRFLILNRWWEGLYFCCYTWFVFLVWDFLILYIDY